MKTSVIIPACNDAKFLPRAVASCQRQPVHEIIVVDDGSTDETPDVCRTLPGIQYLQQPNSGVSRARNTGANAATGDALLFLDADDILLPGAIQALAGRLEQTRAGLAYGMVIERSEPPALPRLNGFAYAEGQPPLPARRNFWRSAIITPGSALVRADLHHRIGGFVTGYEPMEDRDYWIKCGCLEPVAFCDTVVLDKTWRPASHGSQHAKRIYRGHLAQLALGEWCRQNALSAPWIPPPREIVRRALDEAVWRRQLEILPALRRSARRLGLLHWPSAILLLVAGRRPEPDWLARNADPPKPTGPLPASLLQ